MLCYSSHQEAETMMLEILQAPTIGARLMESDFLGGTLRRKEPTTKIQTSALASGMRCQAWPVSTFGGSRSSATVGRAGQRAPLDFNLLEDSCTHSHKLTSNKLARTPTSSHLVPEALTRRSILSEMFRQPRCR